MAATREDLRDHLTAVIEAAQELSREDRSYLADNFLEELERQYQLVPRAPGGQRLDNRPVRPVAERGGYGWWPGPVWTMFLLPALLLPFLLVSLFVFVHPPFFLLAFLLFAIFRFGGFGERRRGPWRSGPRGKGMGPSYL